MKELSKTLSSMMTSSSPLVPEKRVHPLVPAKPKPPKILPPAAVGQPLNFEHLRVPGLAPPPGYTVGDVPPPKKLPAGCRAEEMEGDEALADRVLASAVLMDTESQIGGSTCFSVSLIFPLVGNKKKRSALVDQQRGKKDSAADKGKSPPKKRRKDKES